MELNPKRLSPDRWLLAACGVVVGIALTVIMGWVGDVLYLTILVPGGTPMVMNMAMCLLLSSTGLLALAADRRWVAIGCGALVIAISATCLLQEVVGISLGVNEIFWKHQYATAPFAPGAMSPNAATALLITGGLLVFMGTGRRRHWVIPLMLGIILAFAFLPLVSYLATYLMTGGRDSYRGMALPTAGSLLLMTGALLRGARIAGWRESMALSYMAAAFGMLISIGVFAVQSNSAVIAATGAVVRTYEVRSNISQLVEQVARMESSARGYALTGDESFRDRTFAHQQDVRRQLNAVLPLVAANRGQVQRAIQLRQLAEEKFKSSDRLIRLRQEQGATAAAGYLLAQPTAVRRGLVQLAEEVQAEEGRLLASQEKVRQEVERAARVMQVLGSLLAFGLLGIAVVAARGERSARHAAEATLLKVNHLQRAVLDGTVLSIIATEPDGIIREFNAGAEQMLGYKREEMVGRHTPETIHLAGEVAARAIELSAQLGRQIMPGFEAFVAMARQGQTDEREWTYVRKDGTRLPVRLSVTALRDQAGSITGFLGVGQDLTEMKKAELALQASEEKLGQVLGHAECLVWEARVVLRGSDWDWSMTVYPSGLYHRLYAGQVPDAMVGLWYNFQIPEQPEMDRRSREAMEQGLPGYAQEFRLQRDNHIIWLRETVAIRPQGDGHFWLVGVVVDVSDRKQMEETLRATEDRFRSFAQLAPVGICQTDRQGRCLYVNDRWCEITGRSAAEALRNHWAMAVHPLDRRQLLVAGAALIRGGAESLAECRFVHTDGQIRWVAGSAIPRRNSAGEITGFLGTITDITRRKELEHSLAAARDQALAASKMKSEFLANVSHEIRTPMNGVLGMADLLMDNRLTEDQRQMARVIQASAQNLLKLIDDLLDFSKIEAGKFSITTDDFDLTEQVDQVLALMAPRAVSGQVALECDLPAELPARLRGDAGRIQQVLVNLLGNAVKFTEKGRVTVAVRPLIPSDSGNYAFRIEVRDTGIGISEEQKARLFQPFMQADGSTTRRFGGTGLGLAISRQLVELMNGRIGCESEPGRGSLFWFELELPFAAGPAVTRKTASPAALSGTGARVLVAEDQPDNQLVMHLLLDKLGIKHTIVSDGQAVIEQLGAAEYALVLMDCQMPRIDGYEATRLIRAGAAGLDRQSIPIVALTAHALGSEREKCLEAGMDDYLAKPIRLEVLQAILQRLGIRFISAEAVPLPAPAAAALDPAQTAHLRLLPGRTRSSLLEELAGMALRDMPASLARLRDNVVREAAQDAVQNSHRLAGAAANLGASPFRTVLQDIEQAAESADWPRAAHRLADLDREWALVQQALSELLPKPPP